MAVGSDDEGSDVSDASEGGDPRRRLLSELEKAAAYDDDDEPRSKLMQMKFMQRGEEMRKKENDEAVAELRRQLDSDDEVDSDAEGMEIGRRQYGMGDQAAAAKTTQPKKPKAAEARGPAKSTADLPELALQSQTSAQANGSAGAWSSAQPEPSAPSATGGWAQVESSGRKSKKGSKTKAEEIDISAAAVVSIKPSKPKPKAQSAASAVTDGAQDSDDDDALHLPLAIRDQKLIERAFAGEDVHGQFEEEKGEIEQEDDEKEIDNTLPGWGNWVGDGVSAREKRRHQGRFITKVEGVKKKDRQDFKLKDVIISEKRIRKVCFVSAIECYGRKANTWLRTTSTSRRSCRIRSSRSSSMSGRCGCRWAPNGRPRRRSRTRRSRGLSSSGALLRPCRSPCVRGFVRDVLCCIDRIHKMGCRGIIAQGVTRATPIIENHQNYRSCQAQLPLDLLQGCVHFVYQMSKPDAAVRRYPRNIYIRMQTPQQHGSPIRIRQSPS